jgi:hypothetical protein
MEITFFWDMTPCNLVEVSEGDVEECNRKPEAAHSPRNIGNTARHMASHLHVKRNVLFSVLCCAVP